MTPQQPQTRCVVFPGNMVSKVDGNNHFLSAVTLLDLYGVSREKYKVVIVNRRKLRSHKARVGDIELRPRRNGNYTLPTPLTEEDIT